MIAFIFKKLVFPITLCYSKLCSENRLNLAVEGCAFLTEQGFKHLSSHTVESKSGKSAMLVFPSGFTFGFCSYLRNHD